MANQFPNGTKYAVSTTLAAAIAMTAVSNANPAVAGTPTPPSNGDILVLKSGWSNLNDTVVRAAAATANGFTLDKVDTTDVLRFPSGEGVGTYQVASSFVGLSSVRDVEVSGGEQQFFTYQNVEDESNRQKQDPTYKNPMTFRMQLAYDEEQPWYDTLVELDRKREPVVLRAILPSGKSIYYYGMVSFNKVPTQKVNEHMLVEFTLSMYADPITYGAV